MVNENSNATNREAFIKRKAFELALQYACTGILYDLAMRPDDDREFNQLALVELGFAGREIDDQLIDEVRAKLVSRGFNYDAMVEIAEEENPLTESDDKRNNG
jgi:hypothetical protein